MLIRRGAIFILHGPTEYEGEGIVGLFQARQNFDLQAELDKFRGLEPGEKPDSPRRKTFNADWFTRYLASNSLVVPLEFLDIFMVHADGLPLCQPHCIEHVELD